MMLIACLFQTKEIKLEDETMEGNYTVITVPAHEKLSWIHDRMPAILGLPVDFACEYL